MIHGRIVDSGSSTRRLATLPIGGSREESAIVESQPTEKFYEKKWPRRLLQGVFHLNSRRRRSLVATDLRRVLIDILQRATRMFLTMRRINRVQK